MVFKTLHWYILRELLRIFVLTAAALDVLVALCGVFKPLTKQGLEISQLLTYMINLMPAMLAYTIPIAALFAAVFVHWRLSTDNELTACRASGISFVAIVMPAFVLGLIVALVTLGFVNYVVPIFAHRVERVAVSDLSALLVGQITRQEQFHFKNYIVYADNAEREPSPDPNVSLVKLNGMAFTQLKNGKSTQVVLARQATVRVTRSGPDNADTELSFELVDADAYDPESHRKLSGYFNSIEPVEVPSMLRSKPKFFNIGQLFAFQKDPTSFQPVREIIGKIDETRRMQTIGARLFAQWQRDRAGGKALAVSIAGDAPDTVDRLEILAPAGSIDAESQIHFSAAGNRPIRIEQFHNHKLVYRYTGRDADVSISPSSFAPESASVSLEIKTKVAKQDDVANSFTTYPQSAVLTGLILPDKMGTVAPMAPLALLKEASKSSSPAMREEYAKAYDQIQKLDHTITSELNSRASFSVSCFTLVLLGAALGILLRGRNPLAVFVMGFVPAAFLVLLITTGRELAESGSNKNVPIGVALIWAGNVIVLLLIVGVYAKLLRH